VTTLRLGVLGHPIAHSLSPIMHRAALDALGRTDVTYEAIDVRPDGLAEKIARLAAEGFIGLNVTLPHKTTVLAYLASVDDPARALGAVNTLTLTSAGWHGTNTDVVGLTRSLADEGVGIDGVHAIVLGAGGAARASVLALAGAREIVIVARRVEAAREVALLHPRARGITFDSCAAAFEGADLVVQASSATLGQGARAFVDMLPLDRLPRSAVVADLVYRPRETLLLERARREGLRTVDGVGMLVHQGAASLQRWIGQAPSTRIMRAAVIAAL